MVVCQKKMSEVINKEFNHLKIHTQYSICEGALRTLDLAKYCNSINQQWLFLGGFDS